MLYIRPLSTVCLDNIDDNVNLQYVVVVFDNKRTTVTRKDYKHY